MIVSESVYSVLAPLVRRHHRRNLSSDSAVRILARRLQSAVVVPAERLPAGTVSLGTPVQLYELGCQGRCTWRVVLPSEASSRHRRISVLSPAGATLLGASEGDTVLCRTPSRVLLLRIDKAGDPNRPRPEALRSPAAAASRAADPAATVVSSTARSP